MQRTPIEWTDYSSNPLKYRRKSDGQVVNFCVKLSDGCQKCYAASIEHRFHNVRYAAQDVKLYEPFINEKEVQALLRLNNREPGAKVFIGDMTDIFGEWVPDELLDRMFAVMALCPAIVFQVLTKRAERMRDYLTEPAEDQRMAKHRIAMQYGRPARFFPQAFGRLPLNQDIMEFQWPLPNVWLGVSAEDQQRADERIPLLLQTPAAVRFCSYEPALGPVDFRVKRLNCPTSACMAADECSCLQVGLDLIIVGGESGPGSRPFDIAWARQTVQQCREADVACFVKQLGARPYNGGGIYAEQALTAIDLKDKKGGDINEFPDDLKVREFPGERQTPVLPGGWRVK